MNKPTVLIIGPTPPPYMGPSVATKMIIESELKNKFDLVHLDTTDRRGLANIGKIDFSNVIYVLIHFIKLVSLLIRFSPCIVYLPICQTIRGYLRDISFMVISRIFGARIIIHLRGGYFRKLYDNSNVLAKTLIYCSLKIISRAIVLGDNLKSIFEGLIPSDRIDVVRNGIDENYITDEDSKNNQKKSIMTQPHNVSMTNTMFKHRVLFLSNLMYSKGYYDIIKAIPNILKRTKDIEFYFIGAQRSSKIQIADVKAFITTQNINDHIIFKDTVIRKEKKELLLSADIFAMPTYYKYEGQPWVIVEAMSAGLPIIATDHGSIREMVIDGENGFIVRKQTPEDIAQKILSLVQNNDLRTRMSRQSRRLFLAKFTKKQFIGGLESNFNTVIRESKKSAGSKE